MWVKVDLETASRMRRGPIFEADYRPSFSGHETFPLRYGWLKKAFERVSELEKNGGTKAQCWGDDAIAHFGVGKNMVASIRHWATHVGIVEEVAGGDAIKTTPLGKSLFGDLDPYTENPTTLWFIHWKLAALPTKTTWFWVFSHYPSMTFEREHLVTALERLSLEQKWARVSTATLKNDVACFIRTYVPQQSSGNGFDDALESPLTELGLIKAVGKRDGFRFARGPKSSLSDGMFAYALLDFWSRYSNSATLSFETIAQAPGSLGRVFLLDENDISDRLSSLEAVTKGFLRWSETTGLKQVERTGDFDPEFALSLISSDYVRRSEGRRHAAR